MTGSEHPPHTSETAAIATAEFTDNPEGLRDTLEAHGTLTFTPYASGLFPASELSSETAEAFGMDMAWLRDNAHVSVALHEAGREDLAAPAGRAHAEYPPQ